MLLIMLTILIIIKQILFMNDNDNNNSIHKYEYYTNTKIFFQQHSMSTYYIIDWIICYGILIVSVWESLFSFYRYYTTLFISSRFFQAPIKEIFKYFICYAIPFCILFTLQMHVYYFLFPIIILMHWTFNIFSTWKFAQILVASYRESHRNSSVLCITQIFLYLNIKSVVHIN